MNHLDDLNPHSQAIFAMWLFGEKYARSGLGSMGFWKSLDAIEKDMCRDATASIRKAKDEADHNPPLIANHTRA